MAIHAVEHMIYNPIALEKGNWTVTTKLMKQSFNESRNKKLMTTTPSENDVKQLDYMFAKNSNLIVKIA